MVLEVALDTTVRIGHDPTMTTVKPTTACTIRGIPVSLWRQIKVLAAKRGVSLRATIIRALDEHARTKAWP